MHSNNNGTYEILVFKIKSAKKAMLDAKNRSTFKSGLVITVTSPNSNVRLESVSEKKGNVVKMSCAGFLPLNRGCRNEVED